jgi:hypothetical protein
MQSVVYAQCHKQTHHAEYSGANWNTGIVGVRQIGGYAQIIFLAWFSGQGFLILQA